MTAVRVEVTAADIAAAGDDRRYWAVPVELALCRLTGQVANINGGDGGCIAAIGQGACTIVVDLPAEASAWLDARWDQRGSRFEREEPFAFDLTIDDWLVELVRKAGV